MLYCDSYFHLWVSLFLPRIKYYILGTRQMVTIYYNLNIVSYSDRHPRSGTYPTIGTVT